jgi:hypothetical protein
MPFDEHDNNTKINLSNYFSIIINRKTILTMPSVFQSSNSLSRSVRFLNIIRCRLVNNEKSNIY